MKDFKKFFALVWLMLMGVSAFIVVHTLTLNIGIEKATLFVGLTLIIGGTTYDAIKVLKS